MAFAYAEANNATVNWQTELYNAIIKATGLKGNRATPLGRANFYVLRKTTMCSTLLELGFMDSTVDTPIILTEAYADKVAKAIVGVIIKKGGLIKKTTNKTYRVQVGAYSNKANAENMVKKLKADGYDAIIV
jgi:N-acetylmuramoyl-L-alanine amidase